MNEQVMQTFPSEEEDNIARPCNLLSKFEGSQTPPKKPSPTPSVTSVSDTLSEPSTPQPPSIPLAKLWPIGDLLGADRPIASKKLLEVYGDIIHQNDGTHLAGGIVEDKIWQQ